MQPKRLFTTTLLGAIKHTQLKKLRPVHRYPGNQYQMKLPMETNRKNLALGM
jgi:hypothetical protein